MILFSFPGMKLSLRHKDSVSQVVVSIFKTPCTVIYGFLDILYVSHVLSYRTL